MFKKFSWIVLGVALLAVACGGRQSISPVPPAPVPPVAPPDTGSNGELSLSDDQDTGPLVTVAASVIVTIPVSAPAAKSVSIKVNNAAPIVANVSSGSPGCAGSNPRVCTISASAPTSSDLFAIQTFSGANGSGSLVAAGNVFQTITTTSKTVKITLAGTPRSVTLALQATNPRECDPATAIPLFVMVKDSLGNVIIGPYGETVTLFDSDTSGKTKLSITSVSHSSSPVTLTYNGHPLQSATISAAASGVSAVTDAVLNPLQMMYASNFNFSSITVYPSNAHGNIVPTRSIVGPNTTLNAPVHVALDGSCNLDVANYGLSTIVVFSAGANGNVAPKRTISGAHTLLNNEQGIAVDAAGNIYVANSNGSQILKFSAGASGNVSPIANISGSNTKISAPLGIAVGPTGKIYEVGNSPPSVLVFAAGANGNVSPVATITNHVTPFSYPRGVAVDPSGRIYVTDFNDNNISVFAANANGSSVPIASISGHNTMLINPFGLSLNYAGDMAVSDYGSLSLSVFAKGSNGNVAPKATISGSNTRLNGPIGNSM